MSGAFFENILQISIYVNSFVNSIEAADSLVTG